jgi:hypothetical protein
VTLDQAGRSFDFALPAPGGQALPGMPMLPTNTLPELLGALPGGAAALPILGALGRGPVEPGDIAAVPPTEHGRRAGSGGSPSAGAAQPPSIPGLPALVGVPAVGGLLGGVGRVVTENAAVVLRLTGGELSSEVADTGVHAKAISLRLKLLLVRGEDTTTLIDLCIGVLEVAATAPATLTRERGNDGYGGDGGDAVGTPTPTPTATPSPSPDGGLAGGEGPTGGSRLPLTGNALTAVLGAGVLLLLAGRLLQVIARRRTATTGSRGMCVACPLGRTCPAAGRTGRSASRPTHRSATASAAAA